MKHKVVLETDWILDFFNLKKLDDHALSQDWLSCSYILEQAQLDFIDKSSMVAM